MIRGSCLCGNVRYEIRGPLGPISHCHCSMCRKAHGAAFGSYARVKRTDFALLSGEGDIGAFRSSPEISRTFCTRCGTTLQFVSHGQPGSFALAVGTLDDDPLVRPTAHLFVASKAPWFEITDGLPRRAGYK